MPDARQTTQGKEHTPGRWTRCTGLHPIPDRPRGAIGQGAGRWTAQCLYVACATFLYACTFNLEYTIDLYV